ncbi:ribosomal protein S18-alanine N-acetyltransferase [Chloroflexota bacterium]
MSYCVRMMCMADVAQVTDIDRESFPSMWPPANYNHELQNRLARYIVACDEDKRIEESEAFPEGGFSGLVPRIKRWFGLGRSSGEEAPPSDRRYVVGFAGLWILADEAHIISIAVRNPYLRRGVGELLLISTIDLAKELKAHIITLEVRVSNTAAQNLYSKYGFIQVGHRPGYYTDNKEDAVLMSTENISSASFQEHLQELKQDHSRRWGMNL